MAARHDAPAPARPDPGPWERLSREGANLASRGTALESVVQITLANGGSIRLATAGGTVASRVRIQGGMPLLTGQSAPSGYDARRRLGQAGHSVPAFAGAGLAHPNEPHGRTYFAPSATELQGVFDQVAQDLIVRLAR